MKSLDSEAKVSSKKVRQRQERRRMKMIGIGLAVVLVAGAAIAYFSGAPMTLQASYDRKSAIPAIDTHLHASSTNVYKLEAMAQTNNLRGALVVGSPKSTLSGKGGFTEWRKNNAELLEIAKDPEFDLFLGILPTLDTEDPESPELLCRYVVEDGAVGLKLYDGHGGFHDKPLDSPAKRRVYQVANDLRIPILYHINMPKFHEEIERVLADFPDLILVIPHYMLRWKKRKTLERWMDTYDNVYTDTSFGGDSIMISGLNYLTSVSKGVRKFLTANSHRVLFSSDVVITGAKRKTPAWCAAKEKCMRWSLERGDYECEALMREAKKQAKDKGKAEPTGAPAFTGALLPEEALRDLLYRTPVRVYPEMLELFTKEELGEDVFAAASAELATRKKAREGVDCSKYAPK